MPNFIQIGTRIQLAVVDRQGRETVVAEMDAAQQPIRSAQEQGIPTAYKAAIPGATWVRIGEPPKSTVPCGVIHCKNTKAAASGYWICAECWNRLPELTRDSLDAIFEDQDRGGELGRRQTDLIMQAHYRLSSELAGPMSEDDEENAFGMYYQAGAMGAPGLRGIFGRVYEWDDVLEHPLDLSDGKGGGFPLDKQLCTGLANYYDRAQAARKDPRRAIRLGYGGL